MVGRMLVPYTDEERRELATGGRTLAHPTYWSVAYPEAYDDQRREHRVRFDSRDGLRVTLHLRGTADSVACAGVFIERSDDRTVTARDLRAPIGPLLALLPDLAPWLPPPPGGLLRPARPGPRGHGPEHWRRVADVWAQAQRQAPGREIKWMCDRFREPYPVSDATMRRWRDRAVEWATANNYTPGPTARGNDGEESR